MQESIECVRRRPGMYFGSTRERGVERFVYELVGNVLDCYLQKTATFVQVTLAGDKITVADDGPGFPFDQPSELEDMSLATYFLTHLHATRSVDNHAPHVHVKTMGFGLAPVNIASSRMVVRSWRSGSLWEQVFCQGVAQAPPTILDQGNGKGTHIEVTPDPELFGDVKPRPHIIRQVLLEKAHLFSGLKVGFNTEQFHALDGLKALGMLLLNSFHSLDYFYSSDPRRDDPFHAALESENIFIEAAALGDQENQKKMLKLSWVNGVKTLEGGSHEQGFKKALKDIGWRPKLFLIHVVMLEPEFAGPVRQKLDVPHVCKVVRNALKEPLRMYVNPE
ncbi:MAG: hypothetical protein F6J87_16620 [Spirulina sp. SIO3F2]|nr:hypothetical protein [Spirulina sp. SIO3F2]